MITAAEAAEAARRAPHLPLGEPGVPRLVERLDGGPAYYLVPWGTASIVQGIVQVDAGQGGVLGVTLFQQPVADPLLSPEQALETAAGGDLDTTLHGVRLVWQPCQESTSPVRPFYEVVWADGRRAYVDMSGRTLDRLTPLGRGGGGQTSG
ncbi:MAG: hypothetical protein QOH06_4792 [Acidobacteriota bacterium]|jgi:hypothetical protein|nr:hypothetical protein [Acidobacteriota bacterium]